MQETRDLPDPAAQGGLQAVRRVELGARRHDCGAEGPRTPTGHPVRPGQRGEVAGWEYCQCKY